MVSMPGEVQVRGRVGGEVGLVGVGADVEAETRFHLSTKSKGVKVLVFITQIATRLFRE
jgi:hypothetical protein